MGYFYSAASLKYHTSDRHILKHGVESSFGVEPWNGVESILLSWCANGLPRVKRYRMLECDRRYFHKCRCLRPAM